MSKYVDYYLQAVDEETAAAFLEGKNFAAVDILGKWQVVVGDPWYDPEELFDERQGPTPQYNYEELPGYYFNIRHTSAIESLPEGIVDMAPQTPWRVWG